MLALPLAMTAMAAEHPTPRYKTSLPPSADLRYSVTAKQSGFPLDGDANVKWMVADGKFTLETEMHAAIVGKIIDATTDGIIDQYGLAPLVFTEKRMRKRSSTVTFDRDRNVISFSNAPVTYPITGGEQDRNSAIWQLISVARATPAMFKPGAELKFFVAGHDDAEPWLFKVVQRQKIKTGLGNLNTVQLQQTSPQGNQHKKIEIWLAPSLEWYPVQLRYTEKDGDEIEQTLTSITRTTP